MEASKYQKKVSAANEAFLARRDEGLSEQRQQAALDARNAQANNAAPQGGQFLGGTWRANDWASAAQGQRDAANAQRMSDNAAYRQQIGAFSQRGADEISARIDGQMRGVLTAASLALGNGGLTPMTAIPALANDISDPNNEYIGSAFRGKGRDMRFCVFTRGANGRPAIAKQYTMPELFNAEQAAGGGIFSADDRAVGRKQMGTYMTDQQIDAVIGPRVDMDALTNRVTGGAGGRDVSGATASGGTARRLFGAGGDNRSRISFFGTGGAGSGYTMREYDGHTGEDTGFVNFEQRQWDDERRRAENLALANRGKYGDREDAARVNAESRENIAKMNNESKERMASMREEGRNARSDARIAAQRELQDLKKAGILQKLAAGEFDPEERKRWLAKLEAALDGATADSAPAQGSGIQQTTQGGIVEKVQKLGGKSQTTQTQQSGPVDVSTLGKQKLVEYRRNDGVTVQTNGYEANGKKYDANGNELVDAPVNTATQAQSVNGGVVVDGKTPEKKKSEDEKFDEETESLKKRFVTAGGIVNEDGSFSVSDKEHLKHTRDQIESKYDSIDETLVKRQEFIAKSKKDIADKRKARRSELVKEAKVKFRGNPTAQNKYIEDQLELWDATNDPSVIENNKIRKEMNTRRTGGMY